LFRFLWENREAFRLHNEAHTRVLSVRPCMRMGRDGFILRETVVEYHQTLKLFAHELHTLGVTKPDGMPDDTSVTLYGGNAVIFDEYGHVKYNIGKSILDAARQTARLDYLWKGGAFDRGANKARAFACLHEKRSERFAAPAAAERPPLKREAAAALPKVSAAGDPPADVRWFINQSRALHDEDSRRGRR
jgi:hypothetical protein